MFGCSGIAIVRVNVLFGQLSPSHVFIPAFIIRLTLFLASLLPVFHFLTPQQVKMVKFTALLALVSALAFTADAAEFNVRFQERERLSKSKRSSL